MRNEQEEYDEIYKLDMNEEWTESAYDENGDSVFCDICGGEMKWRRKENLWRCVDCEREMCRVVYFDYIGAVPPGSDCLTNCRENYPFCKKCCDRYSIDPRDPMLI